MDLNTHKTTDPYTQQALTHIHISYLPQIKAWTQTHTWYQVLKSWTQTNTKIQGCVRYGTGILGTGMDVPNLSKFPVPVLMSYRTYRSVRYWYWCHIELTEVSGTGNTGGTPRYVPYRTHPWQIRLKVAFGSLFPIANNFLVGWDWF